MVKRKIKLDLEEKEKELKMNLENNYKDLAQDALTVYKNAIASYYENGELKEKDYKKYMIIVQKYANSMVGYHH